MKISIVIPTHNRAETLRNAIDSIVPLASEADFEFVIVDNNSTDSTKEVVQSYGSLAKYVFEGNTSFTRARKTGADNATGDILLYLDDDVLVRKGSLRNIIDVFARLPDCGVIAGRIDPKYMEEPPAWTLDCQKTFNGWSLFNQETYSWLDKGFLEVPSAAGPMMAIRRSAYDLVGGFPPDTIGVETNRGPKSFNKLYIGPGDYGLCIKIRKAGFKVYYSSDISVFHVIPPVRFSVSFWRSRVIGEGYYRAIAERGFFKSGKLRTYLVRLRHQLNFLRNDIRLAKKLDKSPVVAGSAHVRGICPEELMVLYNKAFLDMDYVLRLYPDLWKFLWKIGDDGVSDSNYDEVVGKLPPEYRELVSNEVVYDATPINSLSAYETGIRRKGYHEKNMSRLLKSKLGRTLLIGSIELSGIRT